MNEILTEVWIQSIILCNLIVTQPIIPLIIVCSIIATLLTAAFMRGSR